MNITKILNLVNRVQLTRRQKTIAAASLGGVVLLAGIATLALCFGGTTPPEVKTENVPQVAKFMASDQFASLDTNRKQQYIQQVSQNPEVRQAIWQQRETLSEQEQRTFRDNMRDGFRQQQRDRMNKYFALKTREDKNKMLDEILEEMKKRQDEPPRQRPPVAQQPRPAGSDQNKSRQQQRMERRETVSPQDRAQHRQFRADLVARAKELGIELPRHHRHR